MNHGKKNRKFGRERGQRKALLRGLARTLVLQGRMKTTLAKAKEIRPVVEKLITRGKEPTLANRRILRSSFGDAQAVHKAIAIAETNRDRKGGYLRIVKMGPRKGDAAEMAVIEFV